MSSKERAVITFCMVAVTVTLCRGQLLSAISRGRTRVTTPIRKLGRKWITSTAATKEKTKATKPATRPAMSLD